MAKLTKRIVDTAEPRSKHERIEICQWGVVRLLIRGRFDQGPPRRHRAYAEVGKTGLGSSPVNREPAGKLGHQRESRGGPAGGSGRGIDDCTADDCALGCEGLCCGMGAACCCDGDEGGVVDIL